MRMRLRVFVRKGEGQRRHQRRRPRHDAECCGPTRRLHDRVSIGKRHELPDGAAHGGKTQRRGAFLGQRRPRDHPENRRKTGSADAKPDQRAGEDHLPAARGRRHQ